METPMLPIETETDTTIYINLNGRPYTTIKDEFETIKTQQEITKVSISVFRSSYTVEEFLNIIKMVVDIPIKELTIYIQVNGLGSYKLDRQIMEVVKTSTSIVDFNITYNIFLDMLGSFVSYVPEDFDYSRPEFDRKVFATIKKMLEHNRSLVGITRKVHRPDKQWQPNY